MGGRAQLTVNGFTYTVNTRDSDTQITLVLRTINFGPSPFVLRKTNDVAPGDWGGLYFGPLSNGSVDNALITYAGGITPIEGGFGSFNAIKISRPTYRIRTAYWRKIRMASNPDAIVSGSPTPTERFLFEAHSRSLSRTSSATTRGSGSDHQRQCAQ